MRNILLEIGASGLNDGRTGSVLCSRLLAHGFPALIGNVASSAERVAKKIDGQALVKELMDIGSLGSQAGMAIGLQAFSLMPVMCLLGCRLAYSYAPCFVSVPVQ